jgi:hypothetical protein
MNNYMKNFFTKVDKNILWTATAGFFVFLIVLVSVIWQGALIETIVASSLAVGGCAVLARMRDQRVAVILGLAFLTRLVLTLIQRFIFALPDTGGDALYFDMLGQRVAQSFIDGSHPLAEYGIAHRYSGFIGFFYAVFGYGLLIPQMINVVLGVVTVWAVSELARELSGNDRVGYAAAFVAALFPTMNLYSAILLREYIMIAPVAVSLVFFIWWLKRGRNRDAYSAIILSFIAPLFHMGMMFLPAAYTVFLMFYHPKERRFRCMPNIRITMVLIVALLLFLPTAPSKDQGDMAGPNTKLGAAHTITVTNPNSTATMQPLVEPSSVGTVNEHLDAYTNRGRAVYLANVRPESKFDVVIQTPIRVIYFLFTPAPWQVDTAQDLFGAFDALLYVILIGFGLWGLWVLGRTRPTIAISLLVIACFFLITFSWGVSNYGAAIRHREKLVFLFIAIGMIGIMNVFSRKTLDTKKV